jgi:hypothetical protein
MLRLIESVALKRLSGDTQHISTSGQLVIFSVTYHRLRLFVCLAMFAARSPVLHLLSISPSITNATFPQAIVKNVLRSVLIVDKDISVGVKSPSFNVSVTRPRFLEVVVEASNCPNPARGGILLGECDV